ncbi:hypothetical protein AQ490_15245 [Wenjunlia vitaminophila]|uniref:Peptidase C39-like domain-containing protein n=1 Tax=Wenjunlia vitaminophila TaxID=76728 RepID=A0A0T6LWJ7_WENVI|nr:peptidase C39 family protein [Wenjunlia vitaminophila]KRV50442.1 hypothetical protein AQ490_15245 [Wenjunlia vitaminophila]
MTQAPRRAVIAAAVAAAAAAASPAASAASRAGTPAGTAPAPTDAERRGKDDAPVDNHTWTSYSDWRSGAGEGVRVLGGARPAITIGQPTRTTEYTDPHTGRTSTWQSAVWTSPVHRIGFGSSELVASWNAHTPAGTWVQVEMHGTYTDGSSTPWYVLGRWAAGDGDIRRTSVDGQTDGKSTIWTDTFSIDDTSSALRLVSYRLRLTLHRRPGSDAAPRVWRAGAMASDIPDRFTVPASTPGPATGVELVVPRYSQEIHKGQYPEYDNGGEAWCSPTSSQMVIEYHGRRPTPADLAWVNPDYADPQVCHAARHTFDWQYAGCGNWPFNAAYATTYRDMEAVITRLRSLTDAETLIRAGLPVITSQSFRAEELDGAGYGTAGHLMCLVGFTQDGNVIANDPASDNNDAVRRVYDRRQFENIWLRTKRYAADGQVRSGSGGIAYVYWPREITAAQRMALAAVGIR